MRAELFRRALIIAFLTAGFATMTGSASGQIVRVFTVNTTSDTIVANACATGAAGCSLRGAITASNPNGDALIQFNIPASDPFCTAGVCTINFTSQPPSILGPNTTIAGPGADRLIVRTATGVTTTVFFVGNSTGLVTISGLTISDGRGATNRPGGVLKSSDGVLDLVEVVVRDSIGEAGGGVRAGGPVNIIRSTIRGNTSTANPGGGVTVDLNTPCNIVNSSIVGNTATQNDGGGVGGNGPTNISNSTIAGNTAAGEGGGVRNNGTVVSVKSTIISGNLAGVAGPDVFGGFTSAGFNLVGKRDGSTGFNASTDQTGTIASPLNAQLEGNDRNNGGRSTTIALKPNSPALDKGSSSSLVGTLSTDQRGGAFGRIRDNPLVANAVGGDGTDIGAYERSAGPPSDFDGDSRSDIGIFRPADGTWWINRSSTGATFAAQFGRAADSITPGDFTGDGKNDIAFWRPSTGQWFILRSEDSSFFAFPFGTNGDIPAPADYDHDGRADPAIFRPSSGTWFVLRSTGGTVTQQFGANGDLPVASDYDGDGRADIAIYRPSNGQWWLSRSTAGVTALTFGGAGDKPVPGDFTGDNKADVAFWRPSTGQWFVIRSENSTFFAFSFGANGDVPAPGDYDGDGKFDATVFRPSNATWFVLRSLGGTTIQQFGANGDRPVASAFVP